MSDYKPVNDRTINDVNDMNKDMWDSGAFKHEDVAENMEEGAETEDRAVHLPRKAKRTWRSRSWS
jgi:t-SNARE complex subunit (syntaxin)